MLENTEGAIKNERSRETDNINQNKNTTQYVLDTTMRTQTQITKIRHEHLYKQLEVKTNRTSF